MSSPRSISRNSLPTIPTGDVVASYSTYEQARDAVDTLVREEGVSINEISIVGSDLRSIERVTGRMSYGRAALTGLGNGLMIGIFLSLMWFIFFPLTDILSVLGVFLMSLAFGVIWGILAYALSGQKREFTSVMQVTASRFDLVVPRELSGQVREVLQRGGTAGRAPQQQAPMYTGQPGQAGQPTQGGQFGQPGQTYGQPQQQYGQPTGDGSTGQPAGQATAGQSHLGQSHSGQSQGSDASGAPSQPVAPAGPPRTFGEMQDEQRRLERERHLRDERSAPDSRDS